MTNVNPLATAGAVSLLCLLGIIRGRARSAPPPLLSGALYSAVADSTTVEAPAQTLASLPQLAVSVPASQRAAFPEGTSAVVHFVARSSYTLSLATKTNTRPSRRPARPEAPPPATAARPTPTAPPPPPSLTATSAPLKSRPAQAQPETFEDYDDALRRSETTQTINARLSRGGVTFRLTQVGVVGSEAVVRYAIANSGSADFFVSLVNVYAGGAPTPSETTGRYACRPGSEIYGVSHFPSVVVVGKKVSVELVESGGAGRRFLLAVDHAF